MGVYVSLKSQDRKHHRYWMAAFLIIGIVGLGLLGWHAKIGDETQEKASKQIKNAVIEATNANIAATNANNAATLAHRETAAARAEARKANKEIEQLARNNIEATTGGNSYPEITIATDHGDLSTVPLLAAIWKTKAAGSFTYVIRESQNEDCFALQSPHFISGETYMIQAENPVFIYGTLRPVPSKVNIYCITMQSKNGGVYEHLSVRFNKEQQRWESKYTILNQWNVVVKTQQWM